jgi:hypothetical protein
VKKRGMSAIGSINLLHLHEFRINGDNRSWSRKFVRPEAFMFDHSLIPIPTQ